MQLKIIDSTNNKFSMKKLQYFVLIAALFLGFFTGCKKGDMDPFFSIYSRKHRVVGEWEINSWNDSKTIVYNDGTKAKTDITISNGSAIAIDTTYSQSSTSTHNPWGIDTLVPWTGVINESYIQFKKTGEVNYTLDFTLTHNWKNTDANSGITYDSTYTWHYTYIKSGTWNFFAKIDDYKNKERLALTWENTKLVVNFNNHLEVDDGNGGAPVITNSSTLESTEQNYANGEYIETWALQELKEKEIIMNSTSDYLYTHAFTGIAGEKETTSGTSKMTLQPKATK